jgi:2-polyprenyl-3-methyl-5-hydroxy-6-metoxy-1,4-benzoquinol methylase
VTQEDGRRWDERYAGRGPVPVEEITPPSLLAAYAATFPSAGRAIDIACGQGISAAWLARRGLEVWGLDVSVVAINQARDLASRSEVDDRCRFDVADLDAGLPAGPPADVILCHRFRDRRLDRAIIERLAPGGLLAIATLSQVQTGSANPAASGSFRAAPGELCAAFAELDLIATGEGQGHAWLLARSRGR